MSFISESNLIESSWYEFERLILRLLQHSGWESLMFTGKSHDQGADILGTPKGKQYPVVVQCKHTGSSVLTADGINDLRRACDFYGCHRGLLVSNSKIGKAGKRRIKDLKSDYNFRTWNFSELVKISNGLRDYSIARKTPRKYQQHAIDLITEQIGSKPRCLVMFATGLGKSIILSEIASFVVSELQEPVLVLADKKTLIQQLEQDIWPQLHANVKTRLWDGKHKPKSYSGVTVATYLSVKNALERGEDLPKFGAVLVDECHHALSPGFLNCLHKLNKSFILGVTATPWRGDNKSLTEYFGNPVATMGIVEGISKGFLAEIDYEMFMDNVNWKAVSSLSKSKMSIKNLNSRLFLPSRDEDMCIQIIERWIKLGKPQCITFCKSIDQAERLADLLGSMGMNSRAIHTREKRDSEKARIIAHFKAQKFSNLIGVEILNEGIDVPDVEMVIFARVTHSRRIFVQQLGRGLRVTAKKQNVKVLDFVADVRRLAEGERMNRERTCFMKKEIYRGEGAKMVKFSSISQGNFIYEYLADIADLEENEKVKLNFIAPE